jgi:hypothetical protein
VRSFVYLDEYKMYSLSSQLMEGVTDFVLKESQRKESGSEEQKGPMTSGRKLAEIIETTSANVEKRFLHDYAFSIFEEKLTESNKIITLTDVSTYDDVSLDANKRRIVRVKAKASFLDAAEVMASLATLVDMQDALSIIVANERREEILSEMPLLSSSSKKGALAALKHELESLSKSQITPVVAANSRLHYKNLSMILQHGFKNRLDIIMDLSDCRVKADLKRQCLKDSEDFIFKTYSRFASVEMVMLGIVTQCNEVNESEGPIGLSPEESDLNMSELILNSTKAIHDLESHFTRARVNQVIVDPIAVYLEL